MNAIPGGNETPNVAWAPEDFAGSPIHWTTSPAMPTSSPPSESRVLRFHRFSRPRRFDRPRLLGRYVAAGEALLSPSVTRLLVSTFAARWAPPADVEGLDTLTGREREVAAWVATGRSNREIGDALFLSPATVRTHVTRVMAKLDARSRAQLVVLAVRAGLTVTP